MSLRRILNCGSLLYDKFYKSLKCSSSFSLSNVCLLQSALFSSFCNSNKFLVSTKTVNNYNPVVTHSRGIKVKGTLQLRCKNCYYVRKDGEMFVMCSTYPRHKQRLLTKKPKYYWILTHACQSKVRPY